MTTEHKPHSEHLDVVRIALEQHTEGYFEQQADALAALDSLEEQLEATQSALRAFVNAMESADVIHVEPSYMGFEIALSMADQALASSPANEPLVTGENLAARVQQAQHLLDKGDEAEIVAWMLGRDIEDVRRVVGSPASEPKS